MVRIIELSPSIRNSRVMSFGMDVEWTFYEVVFQMMVLGPLGPKPRRLDGQQ